MRSWFSCVALLIVLTGRAQAADDNDDLMTLGLEQLTRVRVSTASLREEDPAEAPSSVTVFSHEQIRRLGVRSVEQLLQFVPGFRLDRNEQQNLGYTPSARGRMPGAGVDILLLIDGQRMNDPWSDGATFMNYLLTADHVRQVEVIRGPGSALYGSNAFAAVINVITDPHARGLRLRVGENGERDLFVASPLISGTSSAAIMLRQFRYDGAQYDTPEGHTRDAQRGEELRAQGRWHDLEWRLASLRREAEGFYLFGRVFDPINRNRHRQHSAALSWAPRVGEWETRLDAHWLNIEQQSVVRLIPLSGMQRFADRGWITQIEPLIGGPQYDIQHTQLRGVAHRRFADAHLFTAGLEYRHEALDEALVEHNYDIAALVQNTVYGGNEPIAWDAAGIARPLGDNGTRDIAGVFFQDRWLLDGRNTLVLGWRGDRYDDFGQASTPRLAWLHQYSTDTQFKLLYGRAFRAPSIRRLSAINSPVSIGNRDLKPETVDTTELVWWQKTTTLQSTLTFFHSRFHDMQTEVPVSGLPGLQTTINEGEETTRGLEWEGLLQMDVHWSLRATWSHLFSAPKSSLGFDRDFASLALFFNHDAWQVSLSGVLRGKREHRASSMQGVVRVPLEAYQLWNLRLQRQLADQVEIALQIDNADDSRWWDTGAATVGYRNGIPGEPRRVSLQVDWAF